MAAFADIRRAEVDGVDVAYRRAGEGPAILLVHGIPTSSRLWDAVGAELAAAHDVIALDMVGFGESAKPLDRDVSVAAQARLVPGLLGELGVTRAVVAGHDIGGAVAQIVAVEQPELVAGLVLIDSVCFDSWPIVQMKAVRRLSPLLVRLPPRGFLRVFERALRREVPAEAREPLAASLAAWSSSRDGLRAFLRNVAALDSRHTEAVAPRLGEVAVPAGVVWGERDPFQDVAYAERLRAAVPGATLRTLDARHFVPWERPAETAAAIAEVVARASG